MTKNRVEAFSDGMISIIITIMVLELKTPVSTDWNDIKQLLPVLESYILSFVFIGIYWGNHHHLLHTVKQVNSKIIWANLHLLFWLSLIPFATRWMGEDHGGSTTVAIYAGLMLLCGMAYFILQQSIMGSHHFSEKMNEAMKKQSKKGIISTVAYAASIPSAFINPVISEALFVAVAIIWLIPDKNIEEALKE